MEVNALSLDETGPRNAKICQLEQQILIACSQSRSKDNTKPMSAGANLRCELRVTLRLISAKYTNKIVCLTI